MNLLVFISIAAELCLIAGLLLLYRRNRNLGRERTNLIQEKEVIFNFVHDVAEVFADAPNLELDALLKRVLFYALRTTKAGAGAIYLF